jgi:solute carrier family 50 protein (sugar transporter)
MTMRLMVPPVPPGPTVPLGSTVIQDTNISSIAAKPVVVQDPIPVVVEEDPVWWTGIETVLKVLGTISNIALQLSPLRLVTDMRMHKSALGFSPAPLLALTACGYQWSFYGYFAFNITENVAFLTLVYANILGLVLGLYFLATFYIYASEEQGKTIVNNGLVFLLVFAIESLYCLVEPNVERTLICAGLLSAALSIGVSFAPMVSIRSALAENSLKTLPVDIICASFTSSLLWAVLGGMLHDPWVWIPNLTGLGLGLIQLGACAYIGLDHKTRTRILHKLTRNFEKCLP